MNRRHFSALALAGIVTGMAHAAGAQEQGASAISQDASTAAVYYRQEDLSEAARLSVIAIDDNWQGYDAASAPDRNVRYVAVSFSIEVTGDAPITIKPAQFSLLDNVGYNHGSSPVGAETAPDAPLLETPTELAAGDVGSFTQVFEFWEDATYGTFIWYPEQYVMTMIDITTDAQLADAPKGASPEATAEAGPADGGASTAVQGDPVTVQDSVGADIATIQVTDVTTDWTGYVESQEPPIGTVYATVTVHIETLKKPDGMDIPLTIGSLDIDLIDSKGQRLDPETVEGTDKDVTTALVEIQPGEAADLTYAYIIGENDTPESLIWARVGGAEDEIPLP